MTKNEFMEALFNLVADKVEPIKKYVFKNAEEWFITRPDLGKLVEKYQNTRTSYMNDLKNGFDSSYYADLYKAYEKAFSAIAYEDWWHEYYQKHEKEKAAEQA
ncbi:hypothetical protein [Butyricicoccus sp. Marseille-Q5471]|uniref:hypothetical protein n=1 Tax=Butyricicoccus sp. Marseille-Q5471 TaxID=3039493 RepID=UPI0024BD2AA8|nr:hypothetical protein [Butyricicoccus sp. Marseille-Q5471]